MLQARVELEHFCAERFGLDRGWSRDSTVSMLAIGNGVSCSKLAKRTRCRPCRIKFDVPSPRPTQARINPTVARWKKSSGACQSGQLGLISVHAKHAMLLKRVLQHFAIARLENVKRQQRVRKKDSARQRHDGELLWQSNGSRHDCTASYKIYVSPEGKSGPGEGNDEFRMTKSELMTNGEARSMAFCQSGIVFFVICH